MDWLDVFVVQGTLKSLLQHHSSKALILWHSAFFIIDLSIHTWLLEKPYLWLDGLLLAKLGLCFFICSLGGHRFSSKDQVAFNFMVADTLCSDYGAQNHKVCHCFHCFPIYLPRSDGTRCHDLSFLSLSQHFNSPLNFIKREILDISPGNLDSSLCFIQPSISHDVLCI